MSSSPRLVSIAFAAMDGGQAVGFGLGLLLGTFSQTLSVRAGNPMLPQYSMVPLWHSRCGRYCVVLMAVLKQGSFLRLARDVDWVGVFLISTILALLSYELAVAAGPGAE